MITDNLYKIAATAPERVFLIWEERRFTYGTMARLVDAFAQTLAERGVAEGDRVALLCGNRPAFLVAWFALMEMGAVAVPLNTALVGDGLRHTVTQSGASAILIEPDLLAQKRAVLDECGRALSFVPLDEAIETLPETPPPPRPRSSRPHGALNAILYTSGTTGLPKGAMISNFSYEAAGRDMTRSLGIDGNARILVFLPLFHANPQMYAVASTLFAGATLILLRRFSASEFFDMAKRYEATGFTYVGTVLSILDRSNPKPRRDHGLRWCVGGGAPAEVWREVEGRFGIAVRELYGMTETGDWVSMNTASSHRFGSVGAARDGVSIRILDAEGRDAAPGGKGEIVVRADEPGLFFSGYWNMPEVTAETLRDGWLHTGDRGFLDADGFLHFDGRFKELIRRGGEMISPVEIELQLLKHPGIQDCAIVGVDDDVLGEEIKAFAVPREPVTAEELAQFLASRLPPHMVPRYVAFLDAIPKTETQKIKRHELKAMDVAAVDLRPGRRAAKAPASG